MGLRRSLLIPLIGLLLFLVWMVLYSGNEHTSVEGMHNISLEGTPEGGDFEVDTSDGKIKLSDFKGKVVLLYFGYASCPNVCPSSLSKISLALQNLSQRERSQVKTIFISLDPEHDTVDKIKEYVQYYHGSFIGATVDAAVLKKIAKRYGVHYHRVNSNNKKVNLIDHSAYFYVIDSKGDLVKTMPHDVDSKAIADTVKDNIPSEK